MDNPIPICRTCEYVAADCVCPDQEAKLKARISELESAIREHRSSIETEGLAGTLPSQRLWMVLGDRNAEPA